MEQFVITKKIAKQGKNNVLIIPTFLKDKLRPKTLVKITFDIIEDNK